MFRVKDHIPNIIHFVFGLSPDFGNKPFSLVHYIAIRSALIINKPDKIYFHYCFEPTGELWEKIKPHLTLNKVQLPEQIYGNKLCHFAHKADIIRLQALKEIGGIYLDTDTICVKPIRDLYINEDFVIGRQLKVDPMSVKWKIKNVIKHMSFKHWPSDSWGLCNAVVISQKDSAFIERWLNSYTTFRSKGFDEYWDEHSVKIPLQLAKEYKQEVKLVSPYYFHYPLWSDVGLADLFAADKKFTNSYIHHLWESCSWEKYLSKLTIEKIYNENTTYNRIARQFI